MIKAVLFDVDGVLLDSFEANLKFNQDLMRHTGHTPPTREKFPEYFHLTLWDIIKGMTGLRSDEEIQKIYDVAKGHDVRYAVELITMPPRAGEIIEALSRDYKLGIVTSRIRDHVFASPDLEKLKDYFSTTVAFEETEHHKPHPEPLLLAAKKLGVAHVECVYVGDAHTDIEAGKSAGMKVICYNTKQYEGANAYTDSFEKIPELIKTL